MTSVVNVCAMPKCNEYIVTFRSCHPSAQCRCNQTVSHQNTTHARYSIRQITYQFGFSRLLVPQRIHSLCLSINSNSFVKHQQSPRNNNNNKSSDSLTHTPSDKSPSHYKRTKLYGEWCGMDACTNQRIVWKWTTNDNNIEIPLNETYVLEKKCMRQTVAWTWHCALCSMHCACRTIRQHHNKINTSFQFRSMCFVFYGIIVDVFCHVSSNSMIIRCTSPYWAALKNNGKASERDQWTNKNAT